MDRLKNSLFYLPPLYLVYRYVSLGLHPVKGFDAPADFVNYRNQFYIGYVAILFIFGCSILLRPKTSVNSKITGIVPAIVTSLILTTFSYAIAGLVLDLVHYS